MIVVTGASGRTGRKVAEALLARGKNVRVIGRDTARLAPLVGLGAEAAVVSIEDVPRLSTFFEGERRCTWFCLKISRSRICGHTSGSPILTQMQSHVEFVVNLSSIGAQHPQGTGPIVGLHNQEQKLNRIKDLHVLHLRAAYFMENLFASVRPLIERGTLPGGIRGDYAIPWIATRDIGAYAAERLDARDFAGSSIQELHGQRDLSMNEAASIVGKAIGNATLGQLYLNKSADSTGNRT